MYILKSFSDFLFIFIFNLLYSKYIYRHYHVLYMLTFNLYFEIFFLIFVHFLFNMVIFFNYVEICYKDITDSHVYANTW